MAIKLAIQIAREIRRGEWRLVRASWSGRGLEKDGVVIWVSDGLRFLHVMYPSVVNIPFIDKLIIWYGGGISKMLRLKKEECE